LILSEQQYFVWKTASQRDMVHIWGGMALFPPLATPMQAEDPAHMAGVSFSVDL